MGQKVVFGMEYLVELNLQGNFSESAKYDYKSCLRTNCHIFQV